MPTWSEKQWDKETGGDLTAEQVGRNLTHAALEDAISLTVNLMDALKQVEFESHQAEDFDLILKHPFAQSPRGWLKTIHRLLLDIQQEYEKEKEDAG